MTLSQQVETIGDAYMVVGGVPIPTETHAERVANFALGMRIAAREVTSPITGQPIQVCVCLNSRLYVNRSSIRSCNLFNSLICQSRSELVCTPAQFWLVL